MSGLEMAQNASMNAWTREEVDKKLFDIMSKCYTQCYETSKSVTSAGGNTLPSLVDGANIAGFKKVADAMKDQGEVW